MQKLKFQLQICSLPSFLWTREDVIYGVQILKQIEQASTWDQIVQTSCTSTNLMVDLAEINMIVILLCIRIYSN